MLIHSLARFWSERICSLWSNTCPQFWKYFSADTFPISSVNDTTPGLAPPASLLSSLCNLEHPWALSHAAAPAVRHWPSGSHCTSTTPTGDGTGSCIALDALDSTSYTCTHRENDYIVLRTQGQTLRRVGMVFMFPHPDQNQCHRSCHLAWSKGPLSGLYAFSCIFQSSLLSSMDLRIR